MIITSNRAFAEWPELFGEPLLASAALDRVAHDAHTIVITGGSDLVQLAALLRFMGSKALP